MVARIEIQHRGAWWHVLVNSRPTLSTLTRAAARAFAAQVRAAFAAQRDDLLAALERLLSRTTHCPDCARDNDLARAAIARARGDK